MCFKFQYSSPDQPTQDNQSINPSINQSLNQSIKNVYIELGVYKSDTESFTPLHFLTP